MARVVVHDSRRWRNQHNRTTTRQRSSRRAAGSRRSRRPRVAEWLDRLPYRRDQTALGGWSQVTNLAYALVTSGGRRRPRSPTADKTPPSSNDAHSTE